MRIGNGTSRSRRRSSSGRDPYSASKACAEIATAAYRESFFPHDGLSLSSVRAGTSSEEATGPETGSFLIARTLLPRASPWICATLDPYVPGNSFWSRSRPPAVGLAPMDPTGRVSPRLGILGRPPRRRSVSRLWSKSSREPGVQADGPASSPDTPHEAALLRLDCAKAAERLSWRPVYSLSE